MKNIIVSLLLIVMAVSCGKSTARNSQVTGKIVKVEINVKGMHCTDCETAIIKGVKTVNGVQNVTASYTKGKAWVIYDDGKATIPEISQAIEKKGYQVAGYSSIVNDSAVIKE